MNINFFYEKWCTDSLTWHVHTCYRNLTHSISFYYQTFLNHLHLYTSVHIGGIMAYNNTCFARLLTLHLTGFCATFSSGLGFWPRISLAPILYTRKWLYCIFQLLSYRLWTNIRYDIMSFFLLKFSYLPWWEIIQSNKKKIYANFYLV